MWADETAIRRERPTTGKIVLVFAIAVTSVLPLFFVQADDAELHINVYKWPGNPGG
jgi:hypothetical protein